MSRQPRASKLSRQVMIAYDRPACGTFKPDRRLLGPTPYTTNIRDKNIAHFVRPHRVNPTRSGWAVLEGGMQRTCALEMTPPAHILHFGAAPQSTGPIGGRSCILARHPL